jgi:hypothetical protein
MGEMQVHLTAFLIVCVIVLTAVVRPFGERILLQYLEMGTLLATWATLWAGTVFNTYPRCEDNKVDGTTVAWCDSLSIAIGLLDIGMVIAVIAVVVYYTKQDQCNACCLRLWNKSVGKRRLAKEKRLNEERRSRMDSTEVTSFVNPRLDIETVEKTPELSVELTIVTNSNNVEVEMDEMEEVAVPTTAAAAGGGGVRSRGGKKKRNSFMQPSPEDVDLTKEDYLGTWTEHMSEDGGTTYYYNSTTGKTTWDKPQTKKERKKKVRTLKSKKNTNNNTSSTRQKMKEGDAAIKSLAASPNNPVYGEEDTLTVDTNTTTSSHSRSDTVMPETWTRYVDPVTSKPYYMTATGEVRWEKPTKEDVERGRTSLKSHNNPMNGGNGGEGEGFLAM